MIEHRKLSELLTTPRCGDMWMLSGKRYILVDYVDSWVGITFDNGMRIGFDKRSDFEKFVREGEGVNISRWEDGWFTYCNDYGFTDGKPLSKEVSAAYIHEQLLMTQPELGL